MKTAKDIALDLLENYEKTKSHLMRLGVPSHHCELTSGLDGDTVHIHDLDAKRHPKDVRKRIMSSIKSGELEVHPTDKGALFKLK